MRPAALGGEPLFTPAIPFARPYLPEFLELAPSFQQIIKSGMVTKGEFLEEYESSLSYYLRVPKVAAVSSCTLGLLLLIKALGFSGEGEGEREGREVIVPSFSFFATFHPLLWNRLKPVFVDCKKESFTISPQGVLAAITPRTCGILATYIFGNPPDIETLAQIAKKHNLALLFDAAHALGSKYQGRTPGAFGNGEVFSTSATKLLVTGEGGVVSSSDPALIENIKILREYGNPGDYNPKIAGLNARLTEFQAVLGFTGLKKLDLQAKLRNCIAERYQPGLKELPGLSFQQIRSGCLSSYKDFAILIEESEFGLSRDHLKEALALEGIPTRTYFDPPGHLQAVYRESELSLPITEAISKKILCLPIFSGLSLEIVDQVCERIALIYKFREEISKIKL